MIKRKKGNQFLLAPVIILVSAIILGFLYKGTLFNDYRYSYFQHAVCFLNPWKDYKGMVHGNGYHCVTEKEYKNALQSVG